jgi:hypothetical protein
MSGHLGIGFHASFFFCDLIIVYYIHIQANDLDLYDLVVAWARNI